MLTLDKILYENLKQPTSRTVVIFNTDTKANLAFNKLEYSEYLFDNYSFNYIERTVKADNGATVLFVKADCHEDAMWKLAGRDFNSIVFVDIQNFNESVVGIARSRLRYMKYEPSIYASNSEQFYGFVQLKI